MSGVPRALAIDGAAWFQDLLLREHVSPRHWRRLPARFDVALGAALAHCQRLGATATWFVPGDVAWLHGALLSQLAEAGHEVALLGTSPAPLWAMSVAERERASHRWAEDRAVIEAAIGAAVVGFRALWHSAEPDPESEPEPHRWLLDWLRAHDFAYDATAVCGDGEGEGVVPLRGEQRVECVGFAAALLDAGQPALTGLPPALAAVHRNALRNAADELLVIIRGGARTSVAAALGLERRPPPGRPPVAVEFQPRPRTRAERLAIVVPLKDEEAGIPSLAVELQAVERDLADVAACEFVLVDDGSTDRTWELLRHHFAKRPGCTLVQHPQNRGIAAAIQTGIRATDAELVASIDGDLSYDPLELRAMLALARDADVVTASPYHPRGGVRNVPRWRLGLSRTLSAAYRCLLRSPVRTWTSCFRVYRRSAVADLPLANEGFLGTAELLVRVLRRGGRVAEHPCVLEARLFGVSKLRVLRTIRGHLGLLLQVLWRKIK
ncbi:MAG: glycosyltransferase [Planctomycetota bacterium]